MKYESKLSRLDRLKGEHERLRSQIIDLECKIKELESSISIQDLHDEYMLTGNAIKATLNVIKPNVETDSDSVWFLLGYYLCQYGACAPDIIIRFVNEKYNTKHKDFSSLYEWFTLQEKRN